MPKASFKDALRHQPSPSWCSTSRFRSSTGCIRRWRYKHGWMMSRMTWLEVILTMWPERPSWLTGPSTGSSRKRVSKSTTTKQGSYLAAKKLPKPCIRDTTMFFETWESMQLLHVTDGWLRPRNGSLRVKQERASSIASSSSATSATDCIGVQSTLRCLGGLKPPDWHRKGGSSFES